MHTIVGRLGRTRHNNLMRLRGNTIPFPIGCSHSNGCRARLHCRHQTSAVHLQHFIVAGFPGNRRRCSPFRRILSAQLRRGVGHHFFYTGNGDARGGDVILHKNCPSLDRITGFFCSSSNCRFPRSHAFYSGKIIVCFLHSCHRRVARCP